MQSIIIDDYKVTSQISIKDLPTAVDLDATKKEIEKKVENLVLDAI